MTEGKGILESCEKSVDKYLEKRYTLDIKVLKQNRFLQGIQYEI